MADLYRNSSDARANSKGFNMQRYGDNRRTEQPAFSVIESMTLFFNVFLKKLIFFADQKADNQKVIIKRSGLGIFFQLDLESE